MKAIVVHEFGGPEVLNLKDLPTPRPAAGQVLVRVRAAGVNPYDAYMRTAHLLSSHQCLTRPAPMRRATLKRSATA
jgi:NADPH:quinone reductase-like Zn-dependent oxidoreductase